MRNLIIAAAIAALSLVATACYAEGEGNGDPFPGPNLAVTSVGPGATTADRTQDAYHFTAPADAAPSVGPEDGSATVEAQGTGRDKAALERHTGTAPASLLSAPRG